MADKNIERKQKDLLADLTETASRIRRYSLDPRLRLEKAPPLSASAGVLSLAQPTDAPAQPPDLGEYLRNKAEAAWVEWLGVRDEFMALPASPTMDQLSAVEKKWLNLDRKVDLIQRDLIGENSRKAGAATVTWLVLTLLALIVGYYFSHLSREENRMIFEPWPEWGPWKYGEVAFWSSFGILSYLLFLSTRYLARRDFDEWYKAWYVSTFLRAPFLTVILMMVILEFVEWYGEGKWIETYLLEEGNKFYFIVFMSYCLGLASDTTSSIIRDLTEGVTEFVQKAVARVSQRLSSAVSDVNITPK